MLLCTYELRKWNKSANLYMWNMWCMWSIQFLCERQMQHALCMMTLSLIPVPVAFCGTCFQFYRWNDIFFLAEVPWVNFLLQLQLIYCWDFPSLQAVIMLHHIMQHWFFWYYFFSLVFFSIHCIVPCQIMWFTKDLNWDKATYISKSVSISCCWSVPFM